MNTDITERLYDSEEYSGDDAIPQVASDASFEIEALRAERDQLKAELESLKQQAPFAAAPEVK